MIYSDKKIKLDIYSLKILISKRSLTVLEAACYLGVTVNNLKKICLSCSIPYGGMDGKLYFEKSDLEYLMVLSRQGTDNTKQYISLLNEMDHKNVGNHAE